MQEHPLDSAGTESGAWAGTGPAGAVQAARQRDAQGQHRAGARRGLRSLRPDRRDGPGQRVALCALALDESARAKVRMLRDFSPASAGEDGVRRARPLLQGADGFNVVLDQVQAACAELLEHVREASEQASGQGLGARMSFCRWAPARHGAWVGATSTRHGMCGWMARRRWLRRARTRARTSMSLEAAGLGWLGEPGALRVPRVIEGWGEIGAAVGAGRSRPRGGGGASAG